MTVSSGGTAPLSPLAAAHLQLVDEHIRHENRHDLTAIMGTFGAEAEYADAPWDERHRGRAAVEQYYRDLLAALPDLLIQVQNRVVTDDAVVVEVVISGTQTGTWRGLPATGRAVRFPLCAIFRFAPNGKLTSEAIYYDRAGVLRQVGLYHEPVGLFGRLVTGLTHPVTLARAYARKLFWRSPARGASQAQERDVDVDHDSDRAQFLAIDHVQLAMPVGGETAARAFYAGVLGLQEVAKPAALATRGGAWFASGSVAVHLGVEESFRPARKAHPALRVHGLAAIVQRCEAAGYAITRDAPPCARAGSGPHRRSIWQSDRAGPGPWTSLRVRRRHEAAISRRETS